MGNKKCRICGENHEPWVHIADKWTDDEQEEMLEYLADMWEWVECI